MANYFIHPNELKQNAFLDENVDDKLITNCISIAQDLHILPYIGTGLYDELRTQIGAGTLTALNTTLLSTYIVPAMRFWTLYELVEPMNWKLTNKAIMEKSSENSKPISPDKMFNSLKSKWENIAQWYTERLKKYLLENQASYPLFTNPGNGVDTIHPSAESAFTGGWYLGGDYSTVPDWIKAEYPGTYGTE